MVVSTLYISYDGMTDPLGQSQILPYLIGLSKKGYCITLISCEKPKVYQKNKATIQAICESNKIDWRPIFYHKSPPALSTFWDIVQLKLLAIKLHKQKNFKLVHARSYIASLVALGLKQKYGLKFIFDMRGFWADERVEGGLWNVQNILFKKIYKFFKQKEIQFLSQADYVVSLTENAKIEIHSWEKIKNNPIPIQVIPCCADLSHFSIQAVDLSLQAQFKTQLGIQQGDFVMTYLGSIGTWYMLEEMLDFFVELKKEYPKAIFLFISNDPKDVIEASASAKRIDLSDIKVIKGSRQDVPTLISLSDVSIFFIKPLFSKKASSPTKQGELMAMQIPVITNTGVGDTDLIIKESKSGLLVKGFNSSNYQEVIAEIDALLQKDIDYRKEAQVYYSLEKGIIKYAEVYESLTLG